MKKFFIPLLLCLAALLYAEDPQGVFVNVELLSGTKQKAQFLGIKQDTVQLGGYINNKFTIVHIAKNQFKSIVDEEGNNLLYSNTNQTDSLDTAAVSISEKEEATLSTKIFVPIAMGDQGPSSELAGFAGNANLFIFTILQSIYPGIKVFDSKILDSICGDNLCIQRTLHEKGVDTLFSGKFFTSPTVDSVRIELSSTIYEDSLPTLRTAETTFSIQHFAEDALSHNKMKNLLVQTMGYSVKTEKKAKSFIHVESDPEGAIISRASEYAICKTPCTFAIQDTERVELSAYWNVNTHLWGAQSSIQPIPGDTAKIFLKLKRVNPELRIITSPAGAEIFPGDKDIVKRSDAIGKTPNSFPIWDPGMLQFKLRKIGYRDTLVNIFVPPVSETTINVNLELSEDFEELKAQEQWAKERRTLFIGRTLMGSSIAPIVIGAIFTYLAHLDYQDADDIKKELSIPSSTNGPLYQKRLKENKDLAEKGDRKMIIGGSLIGTGIALFGVGLFWAF